ncbi:IQ domain-containing protein H-like [Copidosoma floridanum]|uniref:IQ domain-containing protein H-like n=1 Tax=Copidosoma floridanum TaxID=29053 RepID=UPI0006C96E00|nr:IQ domain-containing protein H-like [Copidosoma floridanum]
MVQVCPPLPGHVSPLDELRLLDSEKITAEEKLGISRALRNLKPESGFLYRCVDASTKNLYHQVDCTRAKPNSSCECSTNSDLREFYNLFRSKPTFREAEIRCFVDVIQRQLDEELVRRTRGLDLTKCRRNLPHYKLVPVKVQGDSRSESSECQVLCSCEPESSSVESLECWQRYLRERKCKHPGGSPSVDEASLEEPGPFSIGDVGRSEEIGKWGRFDELVQQVLFRLELRRMMRREECCLDSCAMPPRADRFEDVDRFRDAEACGLAEFSRNLMRWSSCTSKRWERLGRFPHQVIHLPSMGYPCEIRCKARGRFLPIQSAQVGRLGWLVNRNAQVIYVCPGKSNGETEFVLRSFVELARPDACLSNLWIIANDEECLCQEVEEGYRSGCENLFYTPSVYRRVRRLTAGRRSFIIPGVLCKTDVFIACELRTSIVGPHLAFQNRLLDKHYVMALLSASGIRHPPFAPVRTLSDLCDALARMIFHHGWRDRKKWLLKVNCGFCGHQSALVCLDCGEFCELSEENLRGYLVDALPRKIRVNRKAYKDAKDFFVEIERHGGVLVGCPGVEFRTVSLGCFIEHDTAEARLCTAADVLQTRADYGWTDFGYIIPQSTLPMDTLRQLVVQLGGAMLLEQYIGYYGVDLVVFRDEDTDGSKELNYWVVDVDPYYTDLISFDDWRRFCLDIPLTDRYTCLYSSKRCACISPCDGPSASRCEKRDNRYVVCSGKLYMDGLSHCSGNFLVDLCKEHRIAYSSKARTGCMICPIDADWRAFLLFAFCSDKRMALGYFTRALQALSSASLDPKDVNTVKLVNDITNSIDNPFEQGGEKPRETVKRIDGRGNAGDC